MSYWIPKVCCYLLISQQLLLVCQSYTALKHLTRRRCYNSRLQASMQPFEDSSIFDVVVVGGSAAGLSAALSLGRSLRKTLVVDDHQPCNQYQLESHNLLGFDGVPPSEILAKARDDVQQYEMVKLVTSRVESIHRYSPGELFSVRISDLESSEDKRVQSRKIILATGVKDILPTHIPGLQACWGKSAIHCPYCHGFEFKHQRTALWMSPSNVRQMAPILRTTFTEQLCVVGAKEWDQDEETNALRKQLEQHDIGIHTQSIAEIEHSSEGMMTSIVLDDGLELPMDCVYIRPPMEQTFRSGQITLNDNEGLKMDVKGYIHVDSDTQKTSIEGIMACGDCTTPNRAVSIAVAGGTRAAKMLNYELAMDDWKQDLSSRM